MWINDLFKVQKPILAMCHLQAMPTDPQYDPEKGIQYVIDCGRKDLLALQEGGVDGIIFSNEYSQPYTHNIRPVTLATMGRVIGELMKDIRVPYGVDVISSAEASLDLAVGVDAQFIREVISGNFTGANGFVDKDHGEIARHRTDLGGRNIKILSYVIPEGSDYFGTHTLAQLTKITEFEAKPDALCVAGLIAGDATETQSLSIVKNAVTHTPVFVNTGCRKETIRDQLAIADGAIVATTFKYDGKFENLVDVNRVKEFMDVVKEYRKTL